MGTRSVSGPRLQVNLTGSILNTFSAGNTASAGIGTSFSSTLTSGVSTNECDRAWQLVNQTLSAASTQVIDLFDFVGIDAGAGDGNDLLGQAMTPLHEIVAIFIKNENLATDSAQLEIEPDASNGWTPIGSHTAANGGALYGQGVLLKFQPYTTAFQVVDASSHRLLLTATGGDVNYSIWILGRSDTDESSSSSSSSSSNSSSSSSSSSSNSSSSSDSSSSSFSSSSSSSISAESSSFSSQSSSPSSVSTSESSSSFS